MGYYDSPATLTGQAIRRIMELTRRAILHRRIGYSGAVLDRQASRLFDAVRDGRFGMHAWALYQGAGR